MAVAKSYETWELVGEPFEESKKMYVKVKRPCPRCGGSGHYSRNAMGDTTCYRCNGNCFELSKVRWYTESQRAAMDRAAEKREADKLAKQEACRVKWAARNAFGFGEDGYITIFKGDADVLNDWAHETSPCRARYNTYFGWFCPSTMEIVNLPDSIEKIRLNWDDVRDINDAESLSMKDGAEVRKFVQVLLNGESTSTYQGNVGEWIERALVVKKNSFVDGRYGGSHFHVMEDSDGNIYVWSTSSKNLAVGTECKLKMKVKEHQDYNGVQQTVVYYCKEI